MEITISEQHERPLLKRVESTVRVFYEGTTPSRAQLRPLIAEKLGVKKELLIVDSIDVSFGDTVAHVTCRAYTDKKTLETLERKTLQEKNVTQEPAQEAAPESSDEEPESSEEKPQEEN